MSVLCRSVLCFALLTAPFVVATATTTDDTIVTTAADDINNTTTTHQTVSQEDELTSSVSPTDPIVVPIADSNSTVAEASTSGQASGLQPQHQPTEMAEAGMELPMTAGNETMSEEQDESNFIEIAPQLNNETAANNESTTSISKDFDESASTIEQTLLSNTSTFNDTESNPNSTDTDTPTAITAEADELTSAVNEATGSSEDDEDVDDMPDVAEEENPISRVVVNDVDAKDGHVEAEPLEAETADVNADADALAEVDSFTNDEEPVAADLALHTASHPVSTSTSPFSTPTSVLLLIGLTLLAIVVVVSVYRYAVYNRMLKRVNENPLTLAETSRLV